MANSNALSQMLHSAARALRVSIGVLIGYVLVRIYRWHRNRVAVYTLMRSQQYPQVYPSFWFGYMSVVVKHMHRLYDWKLDQFKNIDAKSIWGITPFWQNEQCTLSTVDPAVIKHALKDNFENYGKAGLDTLLGDLLGNGIFVVSHGKSEKDGGKHWYMQRKITSKIMTRNRFRTHMQLVFSNNTRKFTNIVKQNCGVPIDLSTFFFRYTLDSIGEIGFGIDLDTLSKEHVPFADAFDDAQRHILNRFTQPMSASYLGKFVYKSEREMTKVIKVLDDFCAEVIAQRRVEGAEGKGDVLSMFLMEMQQQQRSKELKEGKSVSAAEAKKAAASDDVLLRDVILSLLIAGRDTTATCLSFGFLLLCRNPEVQEKLREEVQQHIAEQRACKTTSSTEEDGVYMPVLEDFTNMPYLDGCIKESLRLFPPVPTDIRVSVNDDVLPDGTKIVSGTRIIYENYVIGRLPSLWDDVSAMKPERWVEKDVDEYHMPTFNGGPRICLGKDLAMFEMKLLMFVLMQQFRFRLGPTPRPDIDYVPGVTLRINGGLECVVEKL